MTVDNVTQILNKIPGDKWKEVMGELDIPEPLREEIQRRYSTDTEKNHACADYYVNCHPQAEWEHLSTGLYWRRQFAALKEKKSLIPTVTGKVIVFIFSWILWIGTQLQNFLP
jgi:hypothetical protein